MKTYIWDFDGTLYDSYPAMLQALMATLQKFGYCLEERLVYQEIKQTSIRQLETRLKVPPGFSDYYHQLERQGADFAIPFSDAQGTLQALKNSGGQHFILTHRDVSSTQNLLEKAGLSFLITDIIGSDSGFKRKPDPEAINYLLEQYQLSPQKTLMIGDRILDIEAGKNAGVRTCLYDYEQLVPSVAADYKVSTLLEITQLPFVKTKRP